MVQVSAIRFLAQNNFDFNTLFSSPINYTRLSELDKVNEQCVFKVGKYNPDVRSFEALSTENQNQLETMMEEIKEWVYTSNSTKRMDFTINSVGVRKALDKQVKKEYMGSGMFFNWTRAKPEAYVEKTKRFKQQLFLRGFAKKNVARDQ